MTPPFVYLYRAYDVDGALLYIGFSADVEQRLRAHSTQSDWYAQAVRVETVAYPSKRQALDAEYEAIRAERPLFNKPTRPRVRLPQIVQREAAV